MARQGYLTIPVPTNQLVPTPTKPWQELMARGCWCSQPCGAVTAPWLHAPRGAAAQPVQPCIPPVAPAWDDARCCPFPPLLRAGCFSPTMGSSGNARSSFCWAQTWASRVAGEPAWHSPALQPLRKAALTLPEPRAWCEMMAENHCWSQQILGHQRRH